MRRNVLLLLVLAATCGATGSADEATPAPVRERDTYDVVLLAPSHPVIIRLHVQVDGAGLKGVRFAYAEQLLKQNDRNGDGVLDQEEAKRIPPLVTSSNASETFSVSESWVSVDRSPADEQVTVAELADWIDRVLGYPFSLAARPQRATQSIDLFGLLDINQDGRLSSTEQAHAESTLRKLDLDEDETFTIDELQPLLSQQARLAAADPNRQSADQPFLLLADEESIQAAAGRIIQRYSSADETDGKGTSGLGAAALGFGPADLARHDANRDGLLSTAELEQCLRDPTPHVELSVQLAQSKPGRPRLQAISDRLSSVVADKAPRGDRLTLVTNGIGIEWRVQANRAVTSDNRNLYKVRFIMADQDKNKYLNEQEFGTLAIANATFAQVDRDGDGMIVEQELMMFVDQEAASSQARIEMTVSHNGKSVFEVLDENVDRRISRREIRKSVEKLMAYDRDGDKEISAVELTGQFVVTLQLGKPQQFRNENAPRMDGANTTPILGRQTDGPAWFLKMDRNRDGDVSRHEFLGPLGIFHKLDSDGDGLISLIEAEQSPAP